MCCVVFVVGCESGVMFGGGGGLYHSGRCFFLKCSCVLGAIIVYFVGQVWFISVLPYYIMLCFSVDLIKY